MYKRILIGGIAFGLVVVFLLLIDKCHKHAPIERRPLASAFVSIPSNVLPKGALIPGNEKFENVAELTTYTDAFCTYTKFEYRVVYDSKPWKVLVWCIGEKCSLSSAKPEER